MAGLRTILGEHEQDQRYENGHSQRIFAGIRRFDRNQADNLIRRWLETDIEQAKLRQQFAAIFRKVLPGKKAATFLQLERRISTMMDVRLTSGLPLAQSDV